MDYDKVRQGAALLLEGIGVDAEVDPNFKDTPDRVARSYMEIFQGLQDTDSQVEKILSATFPCGYSQMVVANGIEAFSMCPHHLLPVRYRICAAYIPSEDGEVLGVSKLCRLVALLARRPVLQEELVESVTASLMRLKGCMGAACIARGEHYCMIMRGVNQTQASIIASSLKGAFLDDPTVRAEFMQIFKGDNT